MPMSLAKLQWILQDQHLYNLHYYLPHQRLEYRWTCADRYQLRKLEIIGSTSAKAVIPKLEKIFQNFGIPEVVKTDNGPPFNGQDFVNFAEHIGFRHRREMPLHPQANGEVERFMQLLIKAIH
ncbi:uncharacterized protein [Procambarus clarkii]|uniref:uncharacterized protein n=1 Tax=Procambarus clarkii TaxID=6728 RepID=UPI0037436313